MKRGSSLLLLAMLFACTDTVTTTNRPTAPDSTGNEIVSPIEPVKVEEKTQEKLPLETDLDSEQKPLLPIHGIISQEALNQYYPGVTDGLEVIGTFGSEKLALTPGNGILVSLLHNAGVFDEMILCTHDDQLTLIDHLYIGKATDFDRTSHTIEYRIIDKSSLQFGHVDWGFVDKGGGAEIDTVSYRSYVITVNGEGEIGER